MSLLIFCLILLIFLFFIKFLFKSNIEFYPEILIISLALPFDFAIMDQFSQSKFYTPNIFFIIMCILIVTLNKKILRVYLIDILFIIFFACIIFTTLISKIYDYPKYFIILILYLSICFLWLIIKQIKLNYCRIFNLLNYIIIYNGVLSILQVCFNKRLLIGSFNQDILYVEGLKTVRRSVGLAGTNNAAGNLSAIFFAIACYNFMKNRRKIDILAIVMALVASALSLTRIGYVAIIVEIIIFFVLSNWKSLSNIVKNSIICIVCLLGFYMIFSLFDEYIINLLFNQRGDTSSYRFFQLNNVFQYILDKPLNILTGIGLGQYVPYLSNNYMIKEIDLHFQYLNVLLDVGILGFISFSILNFYIVISIYKGTNNRHVRSFIWALFIGNLICSNFNPNQFYCYNNVVYYFILFVLFNQYGSKITFEKGFKVRYRSSFKRGL